MSVFPMLILCVVSFGTPSTSSFFKLNVTLAQSIASVGISYEMSDSSFTEIEYQSEAFNEMNQSPNWWNLPVKLFSSKCWPMRVLLSLNTRHIAVECSFGRPSCCNSADSVASSVWYRVALIKMKRMHEMADFMAFKSFLFVANDSFSFSSWWYRSCGTNGKCEIRKLFGRHLPSWVNIVLTGISSPRILFATSCVSNFSFIDVNTDSVEWISASTQSGQSPSPQKRNFYAQKKQTSN